MSTTYTNNLKLSRPGSGDANWDVPLQATIDRIDSLSPLASFAVTFAEVPSASLNVRVGGGSYRQANGTVASYAGVASQALPASATTLLWVTDAGTLGTGAAWPAGAHVRLASVTTGATTVTTIADARLSVVEGAGGHQVRVATVSGAYAATLSDGMIRGNASGGAFTVTLPDATACSGQSFRVFKVDSSSNAITVAGSGGQTINGAGSSTVATQYSSKMFLSNGTNWDSF